MSEKIDNPAPVPNFEFGEGYEVTHEMPDVDTYLKVRSQVGLGLKSREAAIIGLKNTFYAVHATYKGETIAFMRIIGDGALWFTLVDACVLPGHQGAGIGKNLLYAITHHFYENCTPGAYLHAITTTPWCDVSLRAGLKHLEKNEVTMYAWKPIEK